MLWKLRFGSEFGSSAVFSEPENKMDFFGEKKDCSDGESDAHGVSMPFEPLFFPYDEREISDSMFVVIPFSCPTLLARRGDFSIEPYL